MSEHIEVKDVTPVKVHKPAGGMPKKRQSSRDQIYVRAVKGPIESFRRFFGFIFLALFAVIPWIQYDGHQAILLDFVDQRFTIFAMTLWPQDLTLLAYIFIVGAFALFFVTTFAGRVWCGFLCPQTTWVYMYIWCEEKIEGPRNKRIKLDERDMDFDKLWRKTAKHLAWLAIALLTALTFVGYFTPIGPLFTDFFTFNAGFWAVFSILFFTFCTYGNAGWMREIMCTHMCPYARFQSAMFDKDTFTVSYDFNRGETRGPRPRKLKHEDLAAKNLGDCIDCNLCVQVCPTGIDIRNGLQYECINCGACVDACNGVMEKMNYPKGLISFTSEERLSGGTTHIVRPKLIGYLVVLLVMIGLLVADIVTRVPLEVDLIRDRNSLYRENGRGNVENVYTLKILNKSQDTHTYTIAVEGLDSYNILGETIVTVGGGEVFSMPLSLETSPKNLSEAVTEISFHVTTTDAEGNVVEVNEPTKFLYK
ncbi:cytochrome c oxidase accessory protein CcoG [Aestuariibacter sp. A3R04]|uniref:cytochrome c oxidase accessory protein CcoG n=1 Tax=Aestuariibacter sp. A3R04 TaxID=2841571 RepID=UPI001C0A15DE|nr:cytochrome c oxidase accessory protein CcoG [Aestuariibacter sp. A3R04]MBU3021045.1 cytochrome c oxidase accessory protein CcoG [Aestuariibacter sp. A3R04]